MAPRPGHRAPTYWTPLPAGYPRAPKITALLAEFGAPGPYAFIVMLANAAEQGYVGGEKGVVRMGWPALGADVSIPVEAAQTIVRRIAELGEVDLLRDDDVGFEARFRDWDRWHPRAPKDPTAAERKRRQRAKSSGDGVTEP